ncbi:probable ATP-dependent RNA helicase DDX43 [Scaptodrosophila lebanonensis]|uniref:RNA helicase n=1 Tax=Drosophila lebanonensis TaxID=7225 RepID=A0A6J2UEC9_DROLE|nr:probable ATP-dependent RNA helicase DDX43 [Scaptodrosophila lebanonensis]
MTTLNWDDPNYVDPEPPKKCPYDLFNEKYNKLSLRGGDGDSRGNRNGHGPVRNDGGSNRGGSGRFGDNRVREDFCETIHISNDMVDRVVGTGGSNLTCLENVFCVRIKIEVKVLGSSIGNIGDVGREIRALADGRPSGALFSLMRESYENNGGNPPRKEDDLYKAAAARAARLAKLPPLTKDFYKEWPEVANLLQAEVEWLRRENKITVSHVFEKQSSELIPNPVWRFDQCFSEYPDLLHEIEKQRFPKPSPIQSQAWPILLKGHDLIGIAQTGTGKTLAFLLPGLIHTECQSTPRGQRGGANVLVMVPTRELALQIEMEAKKYSFRGMKTVCVYGGGDRQLQISDVERGAEVIVCTPGRLNDLIRANVIDISSVTYLVLDEADRMLDLGFERQIRNVLMDIRPDRQTIMTSATWPPGVHRLAQRYMTNPIQVCVGSLDPAATHSVKQLIEMVEDDKEKDSKLLSFIKSMKRSDKVIIFCGRKGRVDDLAYDLMVNHFYNRSIHGGIDQGDREVAIGDIKSGVVQILIATDVASRGLDIEDITYVLNYDLPKNIEDYVHRVGRTGRAGRMGTSISFITREDWAMANDLIKIMEEAKQEVPEELRKMAERFNAMKQRCAGRGGGGAARGRGRGRGRGLGRSLYSRGFRCY